LILKGKNIVITGSGRGIGRHVAIACAKEGANVGITSRTIEELNETKKLIEDLGTNVKVVVETGDISKIEEVERIFKSFYDQLGPLSGVIANAGYSRMGDSHEFDLEKFQITLDINILGVYYSFRASYPYLKKDDKKDRARFIITGSAAYPAAMPKFAAYTVSKYGVVGLMKALAGEYKRENITFNQVLPTMVWTKLQTPKAADPNIPKPDAMLNPWDFTDEYIFLLSEEANRVNNELIFTQDFQQVRKLISEAPVDKKENWETFESYLRESSSKLLENVKKFRKLIEFLIKRTN